MPAKWNTIEIYVFAGGARRDSDGVASDAGRHATAYPAHHPRRILRQPARRPGERSPDRSGVGARWRNPPARGQFGVGRVQSVKRVGLGLKHETATLELAFDRLIQPGGAASPLASRVLEVDNSRERVTAEGRILGVRSTASIGYRVSGYIRTVLAWELHAHVALLVAKLALVHVPEPE